MPRTPLDPAIQGLIAEASLRLLTDPDPTMQELRESADDFGDWLRGPTNPALEEVQVREDTLGPVRLRWYGNGPDDESDVVVYLHGGGWVAGGIDAYDVDARRLAHSTGLLVASVDYRLAPEHPFPQPLDDCIDALRSVASEPHRGLAIAGDSAGGNLALCAALATRDEALLDAMLLLYPVVDPTALSRGSYVENGSGYLLTADAMAWYWDLYLGQQHAQPNPRFAPLDGELHGLPSTVLVSADFDPLRDEDRTLALRLVEADVETTYLPQPGLTHGFQQMVTRVPSASKSLGAVYEAFSSSFARAINRRLAL